MIDLNDVIGLDFETYSDVDLTVHGLHQYVNSVYFQPLLAAVMYRSGKAYAGEMFDFVQNEEDHLRLLDVITDKYIAAHNAGFEQAVLRRMGIDIPSWRFIDTAVLARAAGAAGKLEAAAPQLLGVDKLASGKDLIMLFSVPKADGELAFNPQIVTDNFDEWVEFARYCGMDAELGFKIAEFLLPMTSDQELANNAATMDMNNVGWNVDMALVREMRRRYLDNVDKAVESFRDSTDSYFLNLNSPLQLKEWCRERGIRASSFDEQHTERMLKSLDKRLASPTLDETKRKGYEEVATLLRTKQMMGGSSLKKLQTIINTVGTDGRLHDQYLHCGAGATYRTTGRGVQMQNLKRLNGEGDDMLELFVPDTDWDNDKLAANLRQVFTASHPDGYLIVGDFSAVESRGLAWLAGEQWKLDAYAKGHDIYKELAGRSYGKAAADITKAERTFGKVGELSCGYGAGAGAVKDFAAGMGVELSEGEASKLVKDWRDANPNTVKFWYSLDDALHAAITTRSAKHVDLPHGYIRIVPLPAPPTLKDQTKDPKLLSLHVKVFNTEGALVLARVIHGTHIYGREIRYWKPSERKTGSLWADTFTHPKTKRTTHYTVWGGKLAGLITQSLCREIFFDSLRMINVWAEAQLDNVAVVGQFHDEIVLDWIPMPGGATLDDTKAALEKAMTWCNLPDFPLAAEIKHDYRYTK